MANSHAQDTTKNTVKRFFYVSSSCFLIDHINAEHVSHSRNINADSLVIMMAWIHD